jgi:dTMP kinase
LRDGYMSIAEKFPGRCRIVDASGTIDEIAASVWRIVAARLEDTVA